MRFPTKASLLLAALAISAAFSNRSFSAENDVSAEKDIVDTAVAAGSFNTLAAALEAADLVNALKEKGPFTVLAPTDEAFAKLPKGTVESLLKPESKDKLISILTYHVVAGSVPAAQVVKLNSAKTLNGKPVQIRVDGGKVAVNNANVITTDIKCSNGIIHVIDSVLLPPEESASTANPRRMMETVVARGAQLYNAGHAGQCAALYRDSMMTLLNADDHGMSAHTVRAMRVSLHRARHAHSSDAQAWILRHGIDMAYRAMSPTPAATALSQ